MTTVTYTSKPQDFYKIIDRARELSDEIYTNRADNISDTVLEAFIGELLFAEYLTSKNIEWKRPQDAQGRFRNPINNSDYGDFEIDGLIYDVKVSTKYDNICIKFRHDCVIDYYVGIRLQIDNWNNKFTIHINGVVHTEDVEDKAFRTLNGRRGELMYLVHPRALEAV